MILKSVDRAKMFKWEFSAIEHMNVFTNVLDYRRLGIAKIIILLNINHLLTF